MSQKTENLFITSVESATAKNGKPFAKVIAKTQQKKQITFYLWNNMETLNIFIDQKYTVFETTYEEGEYPTISSFKPAQDQSIDSFIDNLFSSKEEAINTLDILINQIKSEKLKTLINKIFTEEFKEKFIVVPAAAGQHHVEAGGLLKHTSEVMEFHSITNSAAFARMLNRDIALTGALLHDIGKVYDYNFDNYKLTKTHYLYGTSHLSLGAEIVGRYAEDLSDPDILHIQHIIRSHHFLIEWNAITEPRTLEAQLVFFGDYFSMKQEKYSRCEFDQFGVGTIKGNRDIMLDFNKITNNKQFN